LRIGVYCCVLDMATRREVARMRLNGDFQEFYEANYGRVVATITAVLGDRNEAEDVAQEAFARCVSRWSRLGHYDKPEAWVRQVAVRIAIDSGRRIRRAGRATARLAAQRPSPPTGPGESLAASELGTALRKLPLREREVIVLHYLADLSVDTIAQERGLPVGTVKTRLAAGRRHLVQELTQSSEEVSDAR
jgi:RNA polymerase sigma-70 factor, ECF subfamily